MIRSKICLYIGFAAAVHFGLLQKHVRCEEKEQKPQYQRDDITIEVHGRKFIATILSPPNNKLAKNPALLVTMGGNRKDALFTYPYSQTPSAFLEHGHRVVTFDLPCHGDRIDRFGDGIIGFREMFLAGVDPFKVCIEDAQAVITECIHRGWATPGRIAAEGASRCGYVALRLLAADERVGVAAGLAPVTDWRALGEFRKLRDREDVAELQLTNFVKPMIGRRIYLAIGKIDNRVSTASCQAFFQTLEKAQANVGYDASYVELNLTDDENHSINSGYHQSIEFLLKWTTVR